MHPLRYCINVTLGRSRNWALIEVYELVVHPRLAGHGPTMFAGLPKSFDLKLLSRRELGSGAMV